MLDAADWNRPLILGESIAVQGVCLTVAAADERSVAFDVLAETFRRTNLGDKRPGQRVNLERALRAGDPLGGHVVQGHVDGAGSVRSITPEGRDHIVAIDCEPEILEDIVYKGSIACDGISLTVAAVDATGFKVCIIPHTWEITSLREIRPGDRVNLESDILAKYVRRHVERGRLPGRVSWEEFRRMGFDVPP